jgi:GTP-binding protein
MFIDQAKIQVKAGNGGDGCTAFRREKYVPFGGPSGGDGGRGGHVYLEAALGLNSLIHFRYNPEYKAGRGGHGEGSNRHGRNGEDAVIKAPVGTVLYDHETGELLHDFSTPGERVMIARGGRGGRGNARFATSTRQAPRFHEDGRQGEARVLRLELKLLADVGLVGFPNAGKSTLISRLSAAKPKIANYPFTTLEPVLGVVQLDDFKSFVVADIPGLIEGAHRGAGLGHEFLRHVERTRVLLHLIEVSNFAEHQPVESYEIINRELGAYNPALLEKPQIVVATKMDVLEDPERLEALRIFCERRNLELIEISAVTGLGIDRLIAATARRLDELTVKISEVKAVPALAALGAEAN